MIVSEEAVLTQTLALLPLPRIFRRILMFWYSSLNFFEFYFWTQYHIYMLCYLLVIFCLLFAWVTTNSESLAGRQLHWLYANHFFFIIFSFEGQWKSRNNDLFKAWDGLHIDAQTQRLTYRQTDGHKKVKI